MTFRYRLLTTALCAVFALAAAVPAFAQAKVQVIHNSPDPAAAVVDIYINGALAINNLKFRKATGYVDLPAGATEVVVAPGTSSSAADGLATFNFDLVDGQLYQLFATGVLDPSQFSANPNGRSTAFTLLVNTPSRTAIGVRRVAPNAVHGAPDAPTVSFSVREFYPQRQVTATYGDISRYVGPRERDYILDVSADGVVVASFFARAERSDVGGVAGAVMASGFLTTDDEAPGSRGFALVAVAPDGTTRPLPPAPMPAASQALPSVLSLNGTYPNPFATTARIGFGLPTDAEVTVRVYDLLGREVLTVEQAVTAGTSRSMEVDAASLASGTYIYRLDARMGAQTQAQTGRFTVQK